MSGTGRLAGKVALVTGGSRGLGRGIAEGFAAEGAKLVVNYLKDEEAANAVVDTVRKGGSDAIAVRADIGEVADVTAMVDTAVKKFGTIDILVNNAGMLNSFKLADMSVETWDSMIKVHLRGMFLCTRFVIPHMLKQKGGKVINMSGTFGVTFRATAVRRWPVADPAPFGRPAGAAPMLHRAGRCPIAATPGA